LNNYFYNVLYDDALALYKHNLIKYIW